MYLICIATSKPSDDRLTPLFGVMVRRPVAGITIQPERCNLQFHSVKLANKSRFDWKFTLRNRRVLTCEFDEFCYDFDSVLRAEAKHSCLKSRNLCALAEYILRRWNELVLILAFMFPLHSQSQTNINFITVLPWAGCFSKQNLGAICSTDKTVTGKVERERIWHLSTPVVGTLSRGTDGSGILTESQRSKWYEIEMNKNILVS